MEQNQQAYEQAARVLPIRLRQEALSLPPADRGRAEELRLRKGTGNATFRIDLIDSVFNLTGEQLIQGVRYEVYQG